MNEYDSIKRSLNIIFVIIIGCFLCWDLNILIYLIKIRWVFDIKENLLHELLFLTFVIYFLMDMVHNINDERFMFFPEHYRFNRYKVVRIVYL